MNKTEILLLDTNTVMYLIKGDETVLQLVDQRVVAINFVVEIELLGWANLTRNEEKIIRDLITNVQYFDYSSRIKELTIALRQKYKLKLGDALIVATAIEHDLLLLSADNHFARVKEARLINFVPSL